jgi:hypothetical protein
MQLISTSTFDANNLPYQVGSKYGNKASPTLDFIEQYEYADASLLPAHLKSKAGQPFK